MSYLATADLRSATLAEHCIGLELTSTEASDTLLTNAIARLSVRVDRWTNDHFEPATTAVEVDGTGSKRLELPARYIAVTLVKTRDDYGTLTTLAATDYRLHSSLNAAGTERLGNGKLDWLELMTGEVWAAGEQTVQVTGTYGWTTCPPELKRALAMLVYDHFKTVRADLRTAESVSANNVIVRYDQPDPARGIFTGIREADEIIADYSRVVTAAVR